MRALLPDWCDETVAESPDGALEFALIVARRLSLDGTALARGDVVPRGALTRLAYKHSASVDRQNLQGTTHVAASLAQAVLAAMRSAYTPPLSNAKVLHAALQERGNGIVDFDSILDYCWSLGIPVLPLPNLPVGLRKMDGAALMLGNRPVIVIAKKNASKSWLSFILAHELGHIASGHLGENSSIIDVALKEEATYAVDSSKDIQEAEADQFALSLLGGDKADGIQAAWGDRQSAVRLAVLAREGTREAGAAAGHLILRYAFRTRRWPEAQDALKFLHEDFNPQETLLEALASNLNLADISDDLRDLVAAVTGLASVPTL